MLLDYRFKISEDGDHVNEIRAGCLLKWDIGDDFTVITSDNLGYVYLVHLEVALIFVLGAWPMRLTWT